VVHGHAAPLASEVERDALLRLHTMGAAFVGADAFGAEDGLENVASHGGDRPRLRAARQALACLFVLLLGACAHPQAVRGRHALDERAFAAAAVALEAAVRERPQELSYWLDLGRAYVGKGDAAGAVRAFERA